MKGDGRFSFQRAIAAPLALVGLCLAIVAPGRHGLSAQAEGLGLAPWEVFLTGVALDVQQQILLILIPLVLVWLGVRAVTWRNPGRRRSYLRRAILGVLILIPPLFLVFHVGASEFHYQRGGYPTLYDVWLGIHHTDAASASAPALFFERYRLFQWFFLATWLGILVAWVKGWLSWPARLLEAAVAILILTSCAIGGYQVYRKAENIFPTLSDSGVVSSPVRSLLHGLGEKDAIEGFFGLRALLVSEAQRLRQAGVDGRPWGFPENPFADSARSCEHHPLRRAFPAEAAGETPLMNAALSVSRELFHTLREEPIVWHIVGESFRGDDIQAINPAAPRQASPFINSLFEAAAQPGAGVLASRTLFESGTRTVQGLSAAFCGVGSLPFQWALVRDMGHLPLRCLPDVLVDAGFVGEAIKGYTFEFEKQGPFFRHHGFATFETAAFPPGGPTGSWGFSDRYVFGETVKRVVAKPDARAQYRTIITLSHHGPNLRPGDTPAHLDREVDALLKGVRHEETDRARLLTHLYTDGALESLVSSVRASPLGARSLFVIHADHSTLERYLWSSTGGAAFRHHLPLLILLPPAVASEPGVSRAVAELNAELRRVPISLDDVPNLMLALLSQSRGLKALPESWRWHTLGGQATRLESRPPSPLPGRIWGLSTSTHLFSVDEQGVVHEGEQIPRFESPAQLGAVTPTLRPLLGFLAAFLSDYVQSCPGAQRMR